MDNAKLQFSSISPTELCVSTNTTVLSDQVKIDKQIFFFHKLSSKQLVFIEQVTSGAPIYGEKGLSQK